ELRGWPAGRPWTQTKTCFLGFAIRLSLLMAGSMQGECQGKKPLNSMACKMRLCRIRAKPGAPTKQRWCPWAGSNCRPLPYQGSALPLSHMGKTWCVLTGSNRRHSACKADALPTELRTRRARIITNKRGATRVITSLLRAAYGVSMRPPQMGCRQSMKVAPFPAAASASLLLVLALFQCPARATANALRVAVLDDAPPMAYRDGAGNLTGFSHALAQALCEEMKRVCEFHVTRLDRLVDDLAAGRYDVA